MKKAFISFDYDNDSFLKEALVGQAKHPDTPFEIVDQSLKEPLSGDWKTKIKPRIQRSDIGAYIGSKVLQKVTMGTVQALVSIYSFTLIRNLN